MVQAIGLMVGAYIALRCLSFMSRTGERKEHWSVQLGAVFCFFWTVLMVLILLLSASPSVPNSLR